MSVHRVYKSFNCWDSNSILSHFPSEHRAEAKAVSLESPGEDDAEDGCDQLTAGEAKVP